MMRLINPGVMEHCDWTCSRMVEVGRRIMAKIDAYVPEPKTEYDVSQQRQTLDALNTLINQLNFGYQKDLKDEQTRFEWFLF
jgi:hypothetical protein